MTDRSAPPPAGGSTRESLPGRLVTQVVALISARLQLAQIELEEAQTFVLRRVGWMLALGLFAMLAIQFGGLFLVLYFDGTTRLWIVVGLAAMFLLLAVVAVSTSLQLARQPLALLADTRREISRDLHTLGGQHETP